jgi:adenylate kinase
MRCIVFFGIQGSGKGTQAETLSRDLGFQHVNIGDLFREQISRQSPLGKQVGDIVKRGDLVPDELVFDLIDSAVRPDRSGIVFDGFPRTLNQARHLLVHYEVLQVFFLELAEAEAIARISARRVCSSCGANYNLNSNPPRQADVCDQCGSELAIRNDDRPEAIAKRVQEFYTQTLALKDYFAQQGVLSVINASGTISGVGREIRAITDGILNRA